MFLGDGVDDLIMPNVESGIGANTAWVITDANTTILSLPFAPPFNLEGAGEGTCLIWQISYNGSIFNVQEGIKASESDECIWFSNTITAVRHAVNGGELALESGDIQRTICAGGGVSDSFNIQIGSVIGMNSAWVITDEESNILGLSSAPVFDLEGAGEGLCLLWYLAFNGEINGDEVEANAEDLEGCFSLSNPITITSVTEGDWQCQWST